MTSRNWSFFDNRFRDLAIAGTINIDETTNPVSNKVLDRAIVIDMSAVDLSGFLDGLVNREP